MTRLDPRAPLVLDTREIRRRPGSLRELRKRVRAAHHQEVAPEPDDAEVYELVGDLLDLEPLLRDAVVPSLPFQPVCRADCPGLCSECGARLADDPGHHHDLVDPRWAALSTLLTAEPQTEEKRN